MRIPNEPSMWESAIDGPAPATWYGVQVPNGDTVPFSTVPVGSLYVQTGANPRLWQKLEDEQHDTDWVCGMTVAVARVLFSDFTDGGAAVGTLTTGLKIPAGAYVLRTVVSGVTGFAGNVSAILDVGTATDDDRYNTTAGFNVFASVAALDGGAPSGTQVHTTEQTVVLTLTSDSDFTAVNAGAATVKIFYMM